MHLHLRSNKVITKTEKEEIDKMATNADQMERVINIVQNDLGIMFTNKYKGFLRAMEDNEDTSSQEMARLLGK